MMMAHYNGEKVIRIILVIRINQKEPLLLLLSSTLILGGGHIQLPGDPRDEHLSRTPGKILTTEPVDFPTRYLDWYCTLNIYRLVFLISAMLLDISMVETTLYSPFNESWVTSWQECYMMKVWVWLCLAWVPGWEVHGLKRWKNPSSLFLTLWEYCSTIIHIVTDCIPTVFGVLRYPSGLVL